MGPRVWHYLYLVIDVWSRKIVAWEVADREDSQIAVLASAGGGVDQSPTPRT